MRSRSLVPVSACLLLASSCSSPPTSSVAVVDTPPPKATVTAEPVPPLEVESVFATPVVVDGEFSDWEGMSPGPNRVAFALSTRGLAFAGTVGPAHQSGVFITVGSPVPSLPPIGELTRGGGVDPPDCVHEREYIDGGHVETERKLPEEVAASCRKVVEAYDDLGRKHAARFAASYRIDKDGIRVVTESGDKPIEGARATWKQTDQGFAFEVTVPVGALPRLSAAPVLALFVEAGPAGAGKRPPKVGPAFEPLLPVATHTAPEPAGNDPKAPPEPPEPTPLTEAVSFEPHADVRAAAFELLSTPQYFGEEFFQTAGISYHPTDLLHVETMQHQGSMAVGPVEELLFEPKLVHGDLSVGLVNAYVRAYAIFIKGRLVELIRPEGAIKAVFARGADIHVATYFPAHWGMMMGALPPGWSVTVISPDGSKAEAVDENIGDAFYDVGCENNFGMAFGDGDEFEGKGFDTFGWKGTCLVDFQTQKKVGVEVTFRWDAAKKRYVSSHRRTGGTAKKPTRGAR